MRSMDRAGSPFPPRANHGWGEGGPCVKGQRLRVRLYTTWFAALDPVTAGATPPPRLLTSHSFSSDASLPWGFGFLLVSVGVCLSRSTSYWGVITGQRPGVSRSIAPQCGFGSFVWVQLQESGTVSGCAVYSYPWKSLACYLPGPRGYLFGQMIRHLKEEGAHSLYMVPQTLSQMTAV